MFAQKIVDYMMSKQYKLFTNPGELNIVYVEDVDAEGNPVQGRLDVWDDRRIVLDYELKIKGNWLATTEPGLPYTKNPLNRRGAARIAFGQYKAWQVGMHGASDRHSALVQVAPVKVYRDGNKDGKRTKDLIDEGLFGINQHWGYDMNKVGKASAGCLVGQSRENHKQFMRLIKTDRRYISQPSYIFWTTIIPGDELI
jgi:hypothetical protein